MEKVVGGNDLLGIVMTVSGIALPSDLLFCSKQGRANTDKPSLPISVPSCLTEEFAAEGTDIISFPITPDSWFVSEDLKRELITLGSEKIVVAGKSNYVSGWEKEIVLISGQWGIDVPSCRVKAQSPTFGEVVLFFFEKSTTKISYLMDFSAFPMRGAEIWHIRKQHHLIEHFWKLPKSVFKIKSMQLQGDGLYAALLITRQSKVL